MTTPPREPDGSDHPAESSRAARLKLTGVFRGGSAPVLLLIVASALWAGCGEDGPAEPPAPEVPRPTTVQVSPATAELSAVGDTVRLAATVVDQNGQTMAGASVSWSSGDASVATVDGLGLVTAAGNGEAAITAVSGEATGSAAVTVAQRVAQVRVSPDSVTLVAMGDTVRLAAEALDANGNRVEGAEFQWSSSNSSVAGVDGSGLVTGNGEGSATITATVGDARGASAITVENLDRAALVALYNATDGPNWRHNINWLTDAPLRYWYEVRTDRVGRVAEIYLGGNNLSGTLPPELGNLANLEWLGLTGNDLTGTIPPELGNLANLRRLSLHRNDLTGAIPPELGNLANLEGLWLSDNNLTGAIPQSFLQLNQLWSLHIRGQDVCVPGASAFVAWFRGIDNRDPGAEVLCNAADVAALESLYELTDGANWTESRGWLSDHPVEDWYGVTADSLGHVTELDLEDNGLAGLLSPALGKLTRMTVLRIANNALDGRLPLSLTALHLDEFHYDGTDLCEPVEADFQRWLGGIASRRGTTVQCAPLTDRDVLTDFYARTGGADWTRSDGWLSDAPLKSWHGVSVDAEGRVVELSLWDNDLTGEIPPELGNLANLERLNLGYNDLTGEIPPELGNLANLEGLWLSNNDLTGEIPPELGNLANLDGLGLSWNDLTGPIPPELGNLANLEGLWLDQNALTGEIPPELGNLANLTMLSLWTNDLTGPIPPELGNLANLEGLNLGGNHLTGEIPPELGNLAILLFLGLDGNNLSGTLPPELGNLANLERLWLAHNALSGPIPPTFGGLASLRELDLSHNAGLAGAMPAALKNLALESVLASGTDLCVPRVPAFEEWLLTITIRQIAVCNPPAAYLVQAVQSRTHPVPLVAGEEALLRVFVTAAMETTEEIPDVRARFYLNGIERHVVDIPGSSTPIPTEIDEGLLSRSANAEIPGRIVHPGIEMVVEVDPDGALDASLGVASRIPQEGRLAVEVREMPVLDLTVIPFLWDSDPDSAIIGLAEGMAADPDDHALLEGTRVLLPVGEIDVTAHAPVASTSKNAVDLLRHTETIRVVEGGGGYYMGMMSGSVTGASGVAYQPGRSNFSRANSGTIAHELGHNMSLSHAPCGVRVNVDPLFPYPEAGIGAWGYDFRSGSLVPPWRWDHMSYCDPAWTSDYHFTNALRHRMDDEGASAAALAAGPVRSLLLWGGVDTAGTPFLNPAFVVEAPPALPDSAGDYTVTGRDASGRELFSLSFAMPVAVSEAAEVSSFVFALPVVPDWADALASVSLSGPAGNATLDGDSDIPMAILRDLRTGQVRGILRDVPSPTQAAMDAAGQAAGQGLEVLFSRGIPNTEAWRR